LDHPINVDTFNLYKFVPRYMTAGYVPVFRETTDPMTAASGSPALCSSSSTVDALSLPVIRIKPIPQLNVRLISDALTRHPTRTNRLLYTTVIIKTSLFTFFHRVIFDNIHVHCNTRVFFCYVGCHIYWHSQSVSQSVCLSVTQTINQSCSW